MGIWSEIFVGSSSSGHFSSLKLPKCAQSCDLEHVFLRGGLWCLGSRPHVDWTSRLECYGHESIFGGRFWLTQRTTVFTSSISDSNQNACRRNLCECDREMARGIVQESLQWKQQLHDRYGFDRERMCSGAGHSKQSAKTQWKFNGTKDKQEKGWNSLYWVLLNTLEL